MRNVDKVMFVFGFVALIIFLFAVVSLTVGGYRLYFDAYNEEDDFSAGEILDEVLEENGLNAYHYAAGMFISIGKLLITGFFFGYIAARYVRPHLRWGKERRRGWNE